LQAAHGENLGDPSVLQEPQLKIQLGNPLLGNAWESVPRGWGRVRQGRCHWVYDCPSPFRLKTWKLRHAPAPAVRAGEPAGSAAYCSQPKPRPAAELLRQRKPAPCVSEPSLDARQAHAIVLDCLTPPR